MATNLCLPVRKFSHATGVRSDNTIPWTHLSASNIYVLLKSVNTQVVDGKLTLDIVQGTTVLETLDVASYVNSAIERRRNADQMNASLQVDQLPIFGITKESLLALRYYLKDGQARRLQLRMQSPSECRQIVVVLERRGLEFQEARPRTARPGTAMSREGSPNRPLTTQNQSAFGQIAPSPTRTGPSAPPIASAGSLSAHYPSHSDHPVHSPYTTLPSPAPSSQGFVRPPFLTRDEVAAPREMIPAWPTTAAIYRSYTTPTQYSQISHSQEHEIAPPPVEMSGERPSSTTQIANLEAIREAAMDHSSPPRTAISSTNMAAPQSPNTTNHFTSAAWNPSSSSLFSSDALGSNAQNARPSTVATSPWPPNLDDEIPPRRELPFPRRPCSEKSNSRPATSSMTLPPLPKSNASPGKSSTSPVKKPPQSQQRTSSSLHKQVLLPESVTGEVDTSSGPLRAADALPNNQPLQPPKASLRAGYMNEVLSGVAERSTNIKIARMSSLVDAPHEVVSPPTTANPPQFQHTGISADPTAKPYAAMTSTDRGGQDISLDEYATLSRDDRMAALEDFMIENLENPAFKALCEDLEQCWQRIALGL